jgi:hypothetical protein
MSNAFDKHEISSAFDAVAQLTEVIEASAARDDGVTAIEILQSLIINREDSPEGRGNTRAAREALDALQAAVRLLADVMRGA